MLGVEDHRTLCFSNDRDPWILKIFCEVSVFLFVI